MDDWFEAPIFSERKSRANIWRGRMFALLAAVLIVLAAALLGGLGSAFIIGIYTLLPLAVTFMSRISHMEWGWQLLHQRIAPHSRVFPAWMERAEPTPEMVRLAGWVLFTPAILFLLALLAWRLS